MTSTVRIGLAQTNPTIGDFAGNAARIRALFDEARADGANLVLFPELALPGYPPKDLVEREGFVATNLEVLDRLARELHGAAAIVGFIDRTRDPRSVGRPLANAAAVIEDGRIVSVHHKALLPTYDVFDEGRWFQPASTIHLAEVAGCRLCVTICEDVWNDPEFWPHRLYAEDPVAVAVSQGAELIVNISASPFDLGKRHLRPRMLSAQAHKHARPLLFVNQVGGQDDLLFDGHSLAIDARGEVRASGREFVEDLVLAEVDLPGGNVRGTLSPWRSDAAAALEALVMGTRDYARRTGFHSAVIGLSGGIDSALTAVIAARALGADQVHGVAMPSRYSSTGSVEDARVLAARLGIHFEIMSIEGPLEALLATLAPLLAGQPAGVTEENIQARIRGVLLMALSNQFGHLVLSTGNKSELGVGYCTLYGDMCGGLAIISDVPKTMVYQLAEEINREREIIPRSTIEKAPSAELRPNQTDQDTLPPYPLLDRMLEAIIERGLDTPALVAEGFDAALAARVARLIGTSEYKRRQAAPGLKLTSKAFGPGRRIPIAKAWLG